MNDAARRTILARRSAFIAAVLTSSVAEVSCTSPQACLDPVAECDPAADRTLLVAASSDACVGKIVLMRAISARCGRNEDLSDRAVFTTSDPSILAIDGKVARGVAVGTVTVIASIDGVDAGSTEVIVRACATDAGADATSD